MHGPPPALRTARIPFGPSEALLPERMMQVAFSPLSLAREVTKWLMAAWICRRSGGMPKTIHPSRMLMARPGALVRTVSGLTGMPSSASMTFMLVHLARISAIWF
jgi:hypothetical protein